MTALMLSVLVVWIIGGIAGFHYANLERQERHGRTRQRRLPLDDTGQIQN